ncbi:MAG: ribulose-phosphate 3-epimerase [Patescibacteria group bacterium]|nr:MAG: ribulose-phosphate 3-epimerase [Patescibacteria group bacterium]
MVEIIPAILVKNQEEFLERLKLAAPHVSRIQWDIMDGEFVDNTTFSDPSVLDDLVSHLPPQTSVPAIEADLMVSDPRSWVGRLTHPGVDQLIFHFESSDDWAPIFGEAKTAGFTIGLAVEPETPFEDYRGLLGQVDRFQAMGGRSGFGGQKFNPAVLEKVRGVRQEFPRLPISIDIGVNEKTAPEMVRAGANILVAGSAVFKSDNVEKAIKDLKKAAAGRT